MSAPVSKAFPDQRPLNQRVPAWVMSLLLHVVLVVLVFVWFGGQPRGSITEGERGVGIAVAHRLADRTEYLEVTADTAAAAESVAGDHDNMPAALAAAATPPAVAQPIDLSGFLAEATAVPSPTGGGGIGNAIAGSETGGAGLGDLSSGGPKATTTFFGVSGSGRRFVYVLDRSDSMRNFDGRPLAAAKAEIQRSLELLGPDQQFQIIFYNNRPSYFEPAGQAFWLLPADDTMKQRAKVFVRAIEADGGTEHFEALRLALRLQPDVIFFLTDARIPQLRRNQLDEVRHRCVQSNTTIHAIEFGVDAIVPEVSFLRVLAAENSGEYRYIDVTKLQPVGIRTE
jgi:hypothetical protein